MNKFEEFIYYERINSEKCLHSLQIFDNRFDDSFYNFLSPLFNNDVLIDNIYSIIDNICAPFKLNNESKFLILSDFLFSMISYDLSDPANLIFKTTRNDYINRIKLRSILNTYLNYNSEQYLIMHKKLLIGLRVNKIIQKTEIRTLHIKKWETVIYFQLLYKYSGEYNIPIGSSIYPFILINIDNNFYSVGSFRNMWKTKRRKREMEDFPICYKSVIKANQIKLLLSENLYDINRVYINTEISCILMKHNCFSIEEYFTNLYIYLQNDKYSYSVDNQNVKHIISKNIVDCHVVLNTRYISMMKDFQIICSFFLLTQNILNTRFYLPCFADNRGRQYYGTLLSPTFYKTYRYLYEFDKQINFFNKLEESIFYRKIMKYVNLIKEFNLVDKNSYILLVLLIEIGKFFVKVTKECFIYTEEFIKNGLINYKIRNINLKFDDLLYVQKIYNHIDNLLEDKYVNINTIIFKDATASGLQNYGIILGYKSEMLKYLNIDGDEWCDTYQYIINVFLNIENSLLPENILTKRKHWKSTIMTIPYNAVWYSCFLKFINSLEEDNIIYKELSNEKKEFLKRIHKDFYNKIKTHIKNEFYNNENKNIVIFKYNKWQIFSSKEYKINYEKARDKYLNIIYTVNEDKESTEKALEANNMHYRDSELVKYILSEFEILSIHDCFGIRLSELHLVMDKINIYYNEYTKKKTYSIYIIK